MWKRKKRINCSLDTGTERRVDVEEHDSRPEDKFFLFQMEKSKDR